MVPTALHRDAAEVLWEIHDSTQKSLKSPRRWTLYSSLVMTKGPQNRSLPFGYQEVCSQAEAQRQQSDPLRMVSASVFSLALISIL